MLYERKRFPLKEAEKFITPFRAFARGGIPAQSIKIGSDFICKVSSKNKPLVRKLD